MDAYGPWALPVCLSFEHMNSAVLFGLVSALGYGVTDYLARIAGRAVGVWRSIFYGDLLAFVALSGWFLIEPEPGRFTFAGHVIAWAASIASAVTLLVSAGVLTRGLMLGARCCCRLRHWLLASRGIWARALNAAPVAKHQWLAIALIIVGLTLIKS